MNAELKEKVFNAIKNHNGLTISEIRTVMRLGRLELRREVMSCITRLAYEKKIGWVLKDHTIRYFAI